VIETVAHHLRFSYANPGSRHAEGRQARRALEDAREKIAALLGAAPEEVIFTSGGTESTNAAIFGFCQANSGSIALTAGEHPATIESCKQLEARGYSLLKMGVDESGRLLEDQYESLPWDELRLATLILAHNETGVIQNVAPLITAANEKGVPTHIDAVQAVGKIPIDFRKMGATSLALAAHKFHGPRGIGALLLRQGANIAPIQFGGHQEAGRRPGTEMVALAAGMARALECCSEDMQTRSSNVQALRDKLQSGLCETCGNALVNGCLENRLPNTLNISFPGIEGEAILIALDLEGIACSLGSTCASGSAEPAPVLVAMGRSEDVYKSAVRFSLTTETTVKEIDEAIERIARVINRLRDQEN
jgi:cysteine desulfurase